MTDLCLVVLINIRFPWHKGVVYFKLLALSVLYMDYARRRQQWKPFEFRKLWLFASLVSNPALYTVLEVTSERPGD
jgi:hypothetical protein